MEVRVLGALTLDGGRILLAPRDRAVMAALTTRLGSALSVESIASALWGDAPPASWSKVIPGCVMRLRRAIAPAAIETTPVGYRLAAADVDLDADRFETLAQRGAQQLEVGEPDRAAHTFAEALALWTGDPFPELPDWEPARIASGRLQELRLGVEEMHMDARLQAGDVDEVAALARARVAEAPLRERRWVVLSVAQYRQGRQADALATVRRARALLTAEFGLDPGPELAELERAMLRQDAALLSERTFRVASAECPYFGLPPAGLADATRFFGREEEIARALRLLEESGVLLVAGSSGVGKSSFARAGIGAEFVARGRPVTVVTPGRHPAESLREVDFPTDDALLIVDQCERAFTASDPAEVSAFFAALAQAVFRGILLIVVRADHLGNLAEHVGFAELIQSRMLMLTPLGPDGLRAVIEKPAEQAGLILEPGLIEVLVRDADGRTLPLLSHALRQVWSRREGRVMTVDGYRASGEIDGAVAKTAEDVLAALPPGEARLLRDILLRLVEASPDGTVIAQPVERSRLVIDRAHEQIIEQLVDARLLTTDEGSVQLSHEALAREWPRLKDWLADDVEGQRIMRHIGSAATAWDAMGRPESELYRGSRLTAAEHWREAADPALAVVEREFLDASAATAAATLTSAQNQLRRERGMVRRLSWVTAGAAGLAIIAVAAGVIAGLQAGLAGERATVAEARRIAALALDEADLDLALLTAVEATRLWDSPETRTNLTRVLSRSPRATSVIRVGENGAAPWAVSLSGDGTQVAVVDGDDSVRLFDLGSRAQLGQYAPFGGTVFASAIDPASGSVTLSMGVGQCAGLRCDDARIGTLALAEQGASGMTTYDGLADPATDVEYSADGALFAAAAPIDEFGSGATLALWRTAPGSAGAPMMVDLRFAEGSPDQFPGWPLHALRFSPDGSLLYVSGMGPTMAVDTASGKILRSIPGNGILAVSPDGARVAVRDIPLSVSIVDPTGDVPRVSLPVSSLAPVADFSPDGLHLAFADGTDVVLVEADTGRVLETLDEHDDLVTAVEFLPTGDLVTASGDGTIVTWDMGDWWEDAGLQSILQQSALVERDERTVTLEQSDRMARVIFADSAVWAERACEVAGRALSAQEWRELLGDRPYAPACRP